MATKFVVFSHGRAGTNFLMNNLRSHPQVSLFMEPFHLNETERSEVNGEIWQTGQSSREFAYNKIFNAEDEYFGSVRGFKLFYFHCRQDPVSGDIWEALRQDRDVRLIFLNRKNLLNKHLSDLRAQATGVWHPRSEKYLSKDYGEIVEVDVDVNRMFRVLTDLYCGYHRVSEDFSNHKSMHIFYEDLEEGSEKILGEVYEFLGLRGLPVVDPFRPGTLSRSTLRMKNKEQVLSALRPSIFHNYIATCPVL